ncbi:MAG: thiamine pyrophosphate-binding protein [Chloroflexi bacterium]|nr:thiamine pyrophosphate-binding protein [Chloroflexota bacterium]
MAIMTGGRAIAEVLRESGVEHCFGFTGGQTPLTLGIYDTEMSFFYVRNEMSASLMADGYARVSMRPGICTASVNGVPHLATGLHEAWASSIPVVAITNDRNPQELWRNPHSYVDQESLFKPITKWTARVGHIQRLPEITRRALRVATTGRPGPVAVIVPSDILAEEAELSINVDEECGRYPALRPGILREQVDQCAELLLGARRPVIVAGGGVLLSQAWEELRELAELLDIPVGTTQMGKGALPEGHPLAIGVVSGMLTGRGGRGEVAREVLAEADLVLLVGTRTDAAATYGWSLPQPTSTIIHIDISPEEIGRNFPGEIGVLADAQVALREISQELTRHGGRATKPAVVGGTPRLRDIQRRVAAWREEVAPRRDWDSAPIKPQRLMKELQAFVDSNTMVVADAGNSCRWVANYLDAVTVGRNFIFPRGFPAIGYGFAMALGAQVAAPERRVICVAGDGGFGYTIMELETALRHQIKVVAIVLNNGVLQMERDSMIRGFGRAAAVDFLPTDFRNIAQAYGCYGVRVERPQDIRDAIASALAQERPAVVDVVTDPQEPPVGWQ